MPQLPSHTTYPRLLGTNEVFVADAVVTETERAELESWIENELARGKLARNPRDPQMHVSAFCAADGTPTFFARHPERVPPNMWMPGLDGTSLPPVCWAIRARVLELLELDGLPDDPYKGTFITHVADGGQVAKHRDFRLSVEQDEYLVLRCNILVQRPDAGGMPVISNREFEIPERGCWAFFPTELDHAATPVQGARSRATLSLGVLVRPAVLWERCFRQSWPTGFAAPSPGARRIVDVIMASQKEVFSVQDVADAVGGRALDVWRAIVRLQRAGCVESLSALHARGGRIISF